MKMNVFYKNSKLLRASNRLMYLFALLQLFLLNSCEKSSNQKSDDATKVANDKSKLSGTYSAYSAIQFKTNSQGVRDSVKFFYGSDPKGKLMLDEEENYMLTIMRNDLPKETSKDGKILVGKGLGTPEQHTRIVDGSIANFGIYKDSANNLVLIFEKATYANWDAPFRQVRPYRIDGDTLIYSVPNASIGNGWTAEFKWLRVKKK